MNIHYKYAGMPLTSLITVNRLTDIIFNNTDLFTEAGMTIDNINVSMFNKVKVNEVYKTLSTIKMKHAKRVRYILSKSLKNHDNTTYIPDAIAMKEYYKDNDLFIYVFEMNDISVPAVVVGDKQGNPYLLTHNLAYDIIHANNYDAVDLGFKLIDLNYLAMSDFVDSLDNIRLSLQGALSEITNYKLYELDYSKSEDNKILDYFKILISKFGMSQNDPNSLEDILYKYSFLPLVSLDNQGGRLHITDAVIVNPNDSETLIKASTMDFNDDTTVIVLSNPMNRYLISVDIKEFCGINGNLYCEIAKDTDIISTGESFKLGNKKAILPEVDANVDVYGGSRRYNNKPFDPIVADGFNHLCRKVKDSITKKGKAEAEITLVNYFNKKMIQEQHGLSLRGIAESCKMFDVMKDNIKMVGFKEMCAAINGNMNKVLENLYNNREYEKIIYLHEIQKHIKG